MRCHSGRRRRGDELPDELSRRDSRLKKIQQAKAELEKEAEEKAEQHRAEAEAKRASSNSGQARSRVDASPRFRPRNRRSPKPRRSATSPIGIAGSCRMGPTTAASCRAITHRRPWTPRHR